MRHFTDSAILTTLGQRLAALRLGRNQTQAALAHEAGVSRRTVTRLEAGESVQLVSFLRVLRAMQLLDGLDQLVPDDDSPLQQLRQLREPARERASGARRATSGEEPWSWGDES